MTKMVTGRLGDKERPIYSDVSDPVIYIYRADDSLPMPQYQTGGSLGIDLYACSTGEWPWGGYRLGRDDNKLIIRPGEQVLVSTGIVINYPEGYGALVFPRSSLYKHTGCIMTNSVGVIDRDFSGPDDVIHVSLKNISDEVAVIEHGQRIAQLVLMPAVQAHVVEMSRPDEESRGGFGSTGK